MILPAATGSSPTQIASIALPRASLVLSGADYTAVASNLFANVRLPASIVAGVLIPLSFGYPLPSEGATFDVYATAALKKFYRMVSIWAYASLLLCIVSASVAINSIAENVHGPASSVANLIMKEYELAWISTNVNFIFGLCGTLVLVALRALLTWEADEGRVAAGFCGSALLLALSVVDEQVQAGGYADGLAQLVFRYTLLSVNQAAATGNPFLIAGVIVAAASSIGAASMLFSSQEAEGSQLPPRAPLTNGRARGTVLSSTVGNAVVAEAESLAASEVEAVAEAAASDPVVSQDQVQDATQSSIGDAMGAAAGDATDGAA